MAAVKLLVLEDNLIISLAQQARFLAIFPFLRSVAQHVNAARTGQRPVSSCIPCGRKAAPQVTSFNNVKVAIARLGGDQLTKFKAMLNAERIRLRYHDASGRTIEKTF